MLLRVHRSHLMRVWAVRGRGVAALVLVARCIAQVCRGGEAVEFARDDVVDSLLQVMRIT